MKDKSISISNRNLNGDEDRMYSLFSHDIPNEVLLSTIKDRKDPQRTAEGFTRSR